MAIRSADFEPLLNAEDAARLLTVHEGTLTRWAREGRVPAHRLGRRVAFRASELNAWLATKNRETVATFKAEPRLWGTPAN